MDSHIYSIIFSVASHCIVFAYFLFAPFRTRLRYGYFKTAMLAILLTAITIAITVLFFTSGRFLVQYSTIGILLWIVTAMILFHTAIKGSYFEILFIILVILNLYVNIAVISKVIVFALHLNISDIIVYTAFKFVILFACTPLIWILLGKLYRQVIEFNMNFSFWRFIWVIPALLYLIFFTKILPDYWRHPMDVGSGDIVFAVLWAFTTYAVFCITLLMLIQNHKGITAQQQTQMISAQLKMQADQYERLLDNIENTARLRHDWRHHLLSINSYAKAGRMADLQNYIEALQPLYISTEETSVCQNHIVDVILQHYATIAKEHGIAITIKADVPKSLTLADTDLCVIFGNLVENAVEACSKANDKWIDVKAETRGKQLALLIKNTYQRQVMFCENVYYSTKHEGPGIGLSSVEKVVKKNHGTIKVHYDEKIFEVRVLFNID